MIIANVLLGQDIITVSQKYLLVDDTHSNNITQRENYSVKGMEAG